MPGPIDGLRAVTSPDTLIAQRQKVNQVMGGVMSPTQPPPPPQPQGPMSTEERALFGLQTGIPPNPAAQDVDLPVPFDELMRRANSIQTPGGPR